MGFVHSFRRERDAVRAELAPYRGAATSAPLTWPQKETFYHAALAVVHLFMLGLVISKGEWAEAVGVAALATLYGAYAKDRFIASLCDFNDRRRPGLDLRIGDAISNYANDNVNDSRFGTRAA